MESIKQLTLDEAVMKTKCAFVMESLRHEDLFAVLEAALRTIEDLHKRVTELENKPKKDINGESEFYSREIFG